MDVGFEILPADGCPTCQLLDEHRHKLQALVVSLEDPFPPGHMGDWMLQIRDENNRYREALEVISRLGHDEPLSAQVAFEALHPRENA